MQETSGQPAAVNSDCCYSGEGQGNTPLCFVSGIFISCSCAHAHCYTYIVYIEKDGKDQTTLV